MHTEAYDWYESELAILPKPTHVLEIGSRNITGSVRAHFIGMKPKPAYIGIDVAEGRHVDVIASGEVYQPPWEPDMVICAEVLEHVPDGTARRICQNMLSMLAPRGVALLSMAADPRVPHSAVHGGPLEPDEFYRNVTLELLKDWLIGFAHVAWTYHGRGDYYVHATKGA